MRSSLISLTTLLLVGCSTAEGNRGSETPDMNAEFGSGQTSAPASPSTQLAIEHPEGTAYFAGGCFWGVEHYMQQLDGVSAVESGYMGGHLDNPTYADVSSQTSGHLETVRVTYDPTKITY